MIIISQGQINKMSDHGSAITPCSTSDIPNGFWSSLARTISKVFTPMNDAEKRLDDIANSVNPDSSVINCGNIIDAALARIRGTDSAATAPDTQDGSFEDIEKRMNTRINWNQGFQNAFDAVKNGGNGTTAVVGIQYSSGTTAHVILLTNDHGTVGIIEGQNWGFGARPGLIESVDEANDRYNSDGGSNIGYGIIP